MKIVLVILKKYKKGILKCAIYCSLLIVFIKIHLVHAFQNYLKGGTTFSSLTEEATLLPAPYITFCFYPYFKPSTLNKYGLSWPMDFIDFKDLQVDVSSKWELYQNFSYQYNEDFTIEMYPTTNQTFGIQMIATYRHGLCYVLSHNISLRTDSGNLPLLLKFSSNLSDEDIPKTVHMWLTNATGWYGVVIDDWPLTKPTEVKIPISPLTRVSWLAKISQTDYHFMKGIENFEECFYRIFVDSSLCKVKCFPFIYNFIPNLPPCNTTEEVQCGFDYMASNRKDRYKCLKQKKTVQYDANFFFNSARESNETEFRFNMYFDKSTKDVKEEILMVPIEDFIGSIGGSLGLFVGFSCFTYLSLFIDKVFHD